VLFAGNGFDDLKIEADTNFDCVGTCDLKKSIVKPGSLSHTNSGLGERQTRKDDCIKALNGSYRVGLANAEFSRMKLLQAANREKEQSATITPWICEDSILYEVRLPQKVQVGFCRPRGE
jgi:hypothetical protein